jgi:DNA-directed RNA polymerase specialized sigma24 family protein
MDEFLTTARTPEKSGKKSHHQVDPKLWIERHGDYLFRYALIRVRNESIAEDVVQDTLLAAFMAA